MRRRSMIFYPTEKFIINIRFSVLGFSVSRYGAVTRWSDWGCGLGFFVDDFATREVVAVNKCAVFDFIVVCVGLGGHGYFFVQ